MAHGQGTWDPQYGTWEPDDDLKEICECCGEPKILGEDITYFELDDIFICDDCIEQYAPCVACGHLTHSDYITEVNGNQYCADCAGELENEEPK